MPLWVSETTRGRNGWGGREEEGRDCSSGDLIKCGASVQNRRKSGEIQTFSFRPGWQTEQVESSGRHRLTDPPTFTPGYTLRTDRACFFFFFLNIIHVCISTVYVFFLLLYYKIPWWPVQKETEGGKEGREGGLLSNLTYSRNQWWEKRRGAQCLDLSIGRSTLCQINPSQIGRKRQEGGRAEGWGRARTSARSLCYSVGSSSRGQLVCLLAGLLSVCNLLVLLPSSLPGWSDRSTEVWLARVAPNRRTDGFALSDEGRQRQIQHGDVTEMCFMFQIHFWSKVWSWCYIYFTVSCAQPKTC